MPDSKSAALGTTIKLNGSNYLLWSRAFLLFLGSQKKKTHVLNDPVDSTDSKYDAWSADDCAVMTWLLNSLEDTVSKNIMFLETAKDMWDTLKQMYSNEKNVSRVFELYEKLFSHTQSGQSVNEYFSTLKGPADEILVYHPLSCAATPRATQWEEFMVAKFLSGLDADLRPVRDNLLSSDNVPSLSNALSRVLRVSTDRADEAASSNSSTMAARVVDVVVAEVVDLIAVVNIAIVPTTPLRTVWETFGKPGRANTVVEPHASFTDDVVSISRAQYDNLTQSINSSSTTASTIDAPSTSAAPPIVASAGAFAVSQSKSWLVDSGASVHITGTKSLLTSFTPSSLSSVHVADGTYSPVTGIGAVRPTPQLHLENVMFASQFPISLLSVSQLTKTHNCSVTFFPTYVTFQDLQTKRTIGGGHECDGVYYLDSGSLVDSRALSATVSPYQWHCRLGHPSSSSLQNLVHISSVDFQ